MYNRDRILFVVKATIKLISTILWVKLISINWNYMHDWASSMVTILIVAIVMMLVYSLIFFFPPRIRSYEYKAAYWMIVRFEYIIFGIYLLITFLKTLGG